MAYIIFGIVLTALGSFFIIFGGILNSKNDENKRKEEYESIKNSIDSLKMDKVVPKTEIEKVEKRFEDWAGSFITNIDSIKHYYRKANKEKEAEDTEKLEKFEIYYKCINHFLDNSLTAYNKINNDSIFYEKLSEYYPEFSERKVFPINRIRFHKVIWYIVISYSSNYRIYIERYTGENPPVKLSNLILLSSGDVNFDFIESENLGVYLNYESTTDFLDIGRGKVKENICQSLEVFLKALLEKEIAFQDS